VRQVYSMTGYGQATEGLAGVSATGGAITVDIRSVNSRFLDLSFKMPDDTRAAEPALREMIAKQIKRGKVEMRVSVERGSGGVQSLDTANVAALQRLQTELAAQVPGLQPLTSAEWLRWPGVVADTGGGNLDLQPGVAKAASAALVSFSASREREGARMAAFLVERCDAIDALAAHAATLTPDAVTKYQARFLQRWQDALATAGAQADDTAARERAFSEAAAYALRIDIAEEIGRLQSHTAECRELLAKGGELGKRLDFLTQELNREANTLSSKAAGIELTRVGMEMKLHIEQMREQVQNIE
jgi:uncharacterized protein (TIGR00255 family)